jgi:protein-tyrosine phosphatase
MSNEHTRILMVCLGNICRSPLAEGLLKHKLNFTKFTVDSAGTSKGHRGEAPDKRSINIAKKNDIDISKQQSRSLTKQDFETFDYIYVMDGSNYRDAIRMADTEEQKGKVIKIMDEMFPGEGLDVPDPFFGGTAGFDNVYRMLDRVTDVIAKKLDSSD